MTDSDPRPYRDADGNIIYLTDEQLKALGPDPQVRRLELNQEAPTPHDTLEITELTRMADDGGLTGVK